MALAGGGHERAFEALVARYRKPLLAHCRRLLMQDGRAEDALQQGLLQAWLALSRGAEVQSARPWLYSVVHNAAITMLRRSEQDVGELREGAGQFVAGDGDPERAFAARAMLAELAALPVSQRAALIGTALAGYSHAEIAQAMGISDGAVRGLIYRARMAMRGGVMALTPPALVRWMAARPAHASPAAAAAQVAGSGSATAGLAGVLAKGGAVMATTGVLAGGVSLIVTHVHAAPAPPGADRSSSVEASGVERATDVADAPALDLRTRGSAAGLRLVVASRDRPGARSSLPGSSLTPGSRGVGFRARPSLPAPGPRDSSLGSTPIVPISDVAPAGLADRRERASSGDTHDRGAYGSTTSGSSTTMGEMSGSHGGDGGSLSAPTTWPSAGGQVSTSSTEVTTTSGDTATTGTTAATTTGDR